MTGRDDTACRAPDCDPMADRPSLSDRLLLGAALLTATFCLAQLLLMPYGRDQGIYAVVADAVLRGGMPYRDAWDFKPPGIYLVYALVRAVLGPAQVSIRIAEIVGLVRKGSDPLSTGILNEGFLSLERSSREIFQILKSLTLYHKERYKLDVRQLVLTGMTLNRDRVVTHGEETVRLIRRKFAETLGDRPFYPELIQELLQEDYSADGQVRRDEILSQLRVKETKKAESSQNHNFKAIVLDGVRILAGAGYQLEESIRKLRENALLLESQNRSFLAQLRKMLRHLFNPSEDSTVYTVDYSDPITAEHRREEIDFTKFSEDVARRAQVFSSLAAKNSASWKRISSAPEEQAYNFLERGLEDLQRYYRKFSALDEYYKSAITDPDTKNRIRGIKVELATLKTSIIKVNQKKHEYVAQKEEIEQMRRLGIRTDAP